MSEEVKAPEQPTYGPAETPEVPLEPVEKPRDDKGRFLDQATAFLRKQAEEAGLSQDEIATSSPAELRQAIKAAALEQKLNAKLEAIAQSVTQKAQPVADEKWEGEDEIAEPIVKILKQQERKLKALEAENSELKAYQRNQATESFAQKADRAFNDLGEDFEHLVGKGSREDLKANSRELRIRQLLIEEASSLAGKDATPGQIAAKIKQAAESLFKVKPKAQEPEEEEEAGYGRITPKMWQEAALAKPSHRTDTSTELPRDARAIAAVEAYFARNGKR